MILEICTDTLKSTIIAEQAGANRIELCADLCIGGTTPSPGLIQSVKKHVSIPIAAMIRPRGGDFCYTSEEIETMIADIQFVKSQGIEAVVFGVLTPQGHIDKEVMSRLIKAARPMEVVCHRAFDMSQDASESLEVLIDLGVDRLLTSAFSNKASDNIPLLQSLNQQAKGRISIMPGGGINIDNVFDIAKEASVGDIHLSGKKSIESQMIYRKTSISMGAISGDDEYALDQADFETIHTIAQKLKSL